MALISRVALACNKCGKEFYNAKANLNIMGEEFYLCDKCMDGLLDYLNSKTEKEEKPEKKRTLTYIQWDKYNLDKLVEYWQQGLTYKEIADKFAVNIGSISNIITRARQSEPGSALYPYRNRFNRED